MKIWIGVQFDYHGLLPSSPLTKALAYVGERSSGLEVFLDDPDVPADTNPVERGLRVIPDGKKKLEFLLD